MAVLDSEMAIQVPADVREGTYGDAVGTVEPGGAEFIPLSERHGNTRTLFGTWTSPNLEFATVYVGVIAVSVFNQSFWAAVLATEHLSGPDFGDELRDPADGLPAVWFQASGSEEPRQRWHLDLWVDPAQVQPRIAAALAAGGTLVSDAEAPSFWVLADPQGNRACLCTWQDRG